VDFVAKPTDNVQEELTALASEIVGKVRAAARARVRPSLARPRPAPAKKFAAANGTGRSRLYKILAIGASTGGTQAIERFLCAADFTPNGILIVQHMPARYTQSFAQRLDAVVPFDVAEAADRDRVERGRVLVAPGGRHMRLARDGTGYIVRLDKSPPVNHQRPSADVLFSSMAKVAGRDGVGVVLTGMGEDGARGLLEMRRAGAYTLAQDEATCVVFGMPRAAIELDAAREVAPLQDLPGLVAAAGRML